MNLFEVGEIKYTDNIPDNCRISITKEEYIKYQQLKEQLDKEKEKNKLFKKMNKVLKEQCIDIPFTYSILESQLESLLEGE